MNMEYFEPIVAAESERPTLNRIEGMLEETNRVPKLVGSDGEKIELSRSVFYALRQLVSYFVHGKAVSVIPVDKELTTQEAADILNVSRPFLVKLLEKGEIPFIKVGTHRRVRFNDLMEYKKRHDVERRHGLAELTQLSQELGLYEE